MRFLSTFLAVILAITSSVILFAPERVPPGIGIKPTPMSLTVQEDVAMKMFGAIMGTPNQTRSLSITNDSDHTLHNIEAALIDKDGKIKTVYQLPSLIAKAHFRLGWAQQWQIETGDSVSIKASLFYPKKWAL